MKLKFISAVGFLVCGIFIFPNLSFAKSMREIDAGVDTAITRFEREVPGAGKIIAQSSGMLIFPSVIKAGIGIGGEYGVGALLTKQNSKKEYYNVIGGSVGFQLGGQTRTVYLFFMDPNILDDFRNSEGWRAGVNGSVTLIEIGADGSVDTTKTNQPIIAFVLGQKGLMYNLTLEGSKFNRIYPEQ